MKNKVKNMRVISAGYYFMGHYRWTPLIIILEDNDIEVEVNPKLSIFDDFNLYALFKVFGIDYEDGKSFT